MLSSSPSDPQVILPQKGLVITPRACGREALALKGLWFNIGELDDLEPEFIRGAASTMLIAGETTSCDLARITGSMKLEDVSVWIPPGMAHLNQATRAQVDPTDLKVQRARLGTGAATLGIRIIREDLVSSMTPRFVDDMPDLPNMTLQQAINVAKTVTADSFADGDELQSRPAFGAVGSGPSRVPCAISPAHAGGVRSRYSEAPRERPVFRADPQTPFDYKGKKVKFETGASHLSWPRDQDDAMRNTSALAERILDSGTFAASGWYRVEVADWHLFVQRKGFKHGTWSQIRTATCFPVGSPSTAGTVDAASLHVHIYMPGVGMTLPKIRRGSEVPLGAGQAMKLLKPGEKDETGALLSYRDGALQIACSGDYLLRFFFTVGGLLVSTPITLSVSVV